MPAGDQLPDLQWTLNYLAGTLDPTGNYPKYDAGGAACVWAGKSIGAYDLLGALNVKAGNSLPKWRDLNGVCNQLAGTTNLEAAGALRKLAGFSED